MLISSVHRIMVQVLAGLVCCLFFQFQLVPSVSAAAACVTLPNGCCKSVVSPGEKDRTGVVIGLVEKETCPDGKETYYADCVCQVEDTIISSLVGATYPVCEKACELRGGKITKQGIGLFPPKAASADAGAAGTAETSANAACFTKKQCTEANPEAGAFVVSDACTGGMGKCRAPETDIGLSIPIGSVKSVKNIRSYIQTAFQYALTIVGIVASIMLIWGGFKYVIGSSAGNVSSSKKTMQGAIIGLILLYASWTLLNALNPATLNLGALDIYLTNKVLYDVPEFCADYKPAPGKTLRFALSGKPPGSIVLESAIFDKKTADTKTGESYYIFGFGTQTCKGQN